MSVGIGGSRLLVLALFFYSTSGDHPVPSEKWKLSETDEYDEYIVHRIYPKPYTELSFDYANADRIMWNIRDPIVSLALGQHPDADVRALQGIENPSPFRRTPVRRRGRGARGALSCAGRTRL